MNIIYNLLNNDILYIFARTTFSENEILFYILEIQIDISLKISM